MHAGYVQTANGDRPLRVDLGATATGDHVLGHKWGTRGQGLDLADHLPGSAALAPAGGYRSLYVSTSSGNMYRLQWGDSDKPLVTDLRASEQAGQPIAYAIDSYKRALTVGESFEFIDKAGRNHESTSVTSIVATGQLGSVTGDIRRETGGVKDPSAAAFEGRIQGLGHRDPFIGTPSTQKTGPPNPHLRPVQRPERLCPGA